MGLIGDALEDVGNVLKGVGDTVGESFGDTVMRGLQWSSTAVLAWPASPKLNGCAQQPQHARFGQVTVAGFHWSLAW